MIRQVIFSGIFLEMGVKKFATLFSVSQVQKEVVIS